MSPGETDQKRGKDSHPTIRAYCSASGHLIRKIFSGVCRGSHWFQVYLKVIVIDDHFSNERVRGV